MSNVVMDEMRPNLGKETKRTSGLHSRKTV